MLFHPFVTYPQLTLICGSCIISFGDFLKKHTSKRISVSRETLLCIPVLLGLLILALALVSSRFSVSYLPGTTVDGVPVASLVPEEALAAIQKDMSSKTVSLLDADGNEVISLPLSAFVKDAELLEQLQDLLAKQRRSSNVFSWIHPPKNDCSIPIFSQLSVKETAVILRQALCADAERSDPQNAFLIYDSTNGYSVENETLGKLYRSWDCAEILLPALVQLDGLPHPENCSVSVASAQVAPSVTADSAVICRATDALDSFIQSKITVDFLNGTQVTLTPEEITSVGEISIDGYTANYVPDGEKVTALAVTLLDRYALDGTEAKYAACSFTRDSVTIPDWDNGWQLNRDAFAAELLNAVSGQKDVTIIPTYDTTASLNYVYACGNSVIEISLDDQFMWMYVDDRLVVQTPVVTGCVATWDDTRRGHFNVYWMEEDLYLSGPTWYDHVDYWMPFDGGIGIHDSSWRSEYGGDIYLEDGSHGCINTPLEAVRTIYENSWMYIPVVVW